MTGQMKEVSMGFPDPQGTSKPLTFCVVSKRFRKNYIHRFTATSSFFIFSPWNPIRQTCIFLSTNHIFDYVVMTTILINCVFLAMTETVEEAEYLFLAIYTAEMLIKSIAKGFILQKYTYLRNPWNWLDFVVITSGYATIGMEVSNLAGLRTFRVLRALKTVSIMPGLKTIINALLHSFKQLAEVMTLTIFCLMVFALFALQVYMGELRNKCVQKVTEDANLSASSWKEWIRDEENWLYNIEEEPVICGNVTGARHCPRGYFCVQVGENPNHGYTNFDNFLWSMLTTFQLITLDYWENVYNMVLSSCGPISVVFFTVVVFFGSFYLINLMLAVVALSYEEEAEITQEERRKDLTDHRDDSTFSFDPSRINVKQLDKKNRKKIDSRKGVLLSSYSRKKTRRRKRTQSGSGGPRRSGANGETNGGSNGKSTTPSPRHSDTPRPGTPASNIVIGATMPIVAAAAAATVAAAAPAAQPNDNNTNNSSVTQATPSSLQPPVLVTRGPLLRHPSSNNSDNRESSLDDSGVVDDHEEGDVTSEDVVHIPNVVQRTLAPVTVALTSREIKIIKCNGVSPGHVTTTTPGKHLYTLPTDYLSHIVVLDDLPDRNCDKCTQCCVDYDGWLRFQSGLYKVVRDPLFDLLITLCIVLNTMFLAMEHHGMSESVRQALDIGNKVFTSIFTLECSLKLLALSKEFFSCGWNIFDLIIVSASLLDLAFELVDGLSVLRGLRLLRVLKLAQSWTTMKVLLSIIISSIGALGNLTFVLVIVIYIFAVIGMQLFSKDYTSDIFAPDPVPRWNFNDFFHSFMMIFRILCGEWIEPLWDCMRAEAIKGPETCFAIFLPALVMGNFMVLNLFLALLLNSFNSEELKSKKEEVGEESKLARSFERIRSIVRKKRRTGNRQGHEKTENERNMRLEEMVREVMTQRRLTMANESPLHVQITNEIPSNTFDPESPPDTGLMARAVKIRAKKVVHEASIETQQTKYSSTPPGSIGATPSPARKSNSKPGEEEQFSEPESSLLLSNRHSVNLPCGIPEGSPLPRRPYSSIQEYLSGVVDNSNPKSVTPLPTKRYSLVSQRAIDQQDGILDGEKSPCHQEVTRTSSLPAKTRPRLNEKRFSLVNQKIDSKDESQTTDEGNEAELCEERGEEEPASAVKEKLLEATSSPGGDPKTEKKPAAGGKGGQPWSAVVSYVDELTVGGRRDSQGHYIDGLGSFRGFGRNKKNRTPMDCFPHHCYQSLEFLSDPTLTTTKSPSAIDISRRVFNEHNLQSAFEKELCTCCDVCIATPLGQRWTEIRTTVLSYVDTPMFEWFILVLIFASSITLCFEDIYLDENLVLKNILYWTNFGFCAVFSIEMMLKWVALGFWKYFTSFWTILDFIIVFVSVFSLLIEENENLKVLRSLRTLRALRPLRAISRWQGMRIVVNALMYAIPSIFNVLLVCLVFWLIFSIMGVQFFGGKFFKCIDKDGELLPVEIVEDRLNCQNNPNYSWINSKITFDNVGDAYLALFQVATFEGWMEVMADAVDARGVDLQPQREANLYAYIYFVIFIVCGSFFTLNLFIGVIIDNFNMLKKKYEGGVLEMFLTESQKHYYTAMKKLGRKKPQKVIKRPMNQFLAMFYDLSNSRRFEIAIFVLIFLNMLTMGIEHYNQPHAIFFVLEVSNAFFTTVFGLEACVKIVGLRYHYFTVPWNLFDFILVLASILGILMEDIMIDFPVSPTLLRVVRVFRIGRILRLIKAAKGIRKLLFALVVSLPALFNIGALLALITFIYAIIGMSVFGHVKQQGALDDMVNFETFGRSMQLLFRLMTSAGWNDVLESLMIQPPNCDARFNNQPNGNCGYPLLAITYFTSFIIISYMIVINMYIAIILENFNQAHQEEEIGIVEDDLEMFYIRWSKYDPHATQFISFTQLSDFIASLDPPLGIPKPNIVALVSFNLPIAKGNKIHCLDILHSLVKYVLGHVEESDDFRKLQDQMDVKFKKQFPTRKELEIVSSTRIWKRQDKAARLIQGAFREYIRQKQEREREPLDLEDEMTQTSSPGGGWQSRLSAFLHVHRGSRASSRKSSRASDASELSELGAAWLNLPLLFLSSAHQAATEDLVQQTAAASSTMSGNGHVAIKVSEPSPEDPSPRFFHPPLGESLSLPAGADRVSITLTRPSPDSAPTPSTESDLSTVIAGGVSTPSPSPPPPGTPGEASLVAQLQQQTTPPSSLALDPHPMQLMPGGGVLSLPPPPPPPTTTPLTPTMSRLADDKHPLMLRPGGAVLSLLPHPQQLVPIPKRPPPPPPPRRRRSGRLRRRGNEAKLVHVMVHRESEENEELDEAS